MACRDIYGAGNFDSIKSMCRSVKPSRAALIRAAFKLFESCSLFRTKKEKPEGLSFWCGQQDSNLHAYAMEPKGDVTLVKVSLSIVCFIQRGQLSGLCYKFLLL